LRQSRHVWDRTDEHDAQTARTNKTTPTQTVLMAILLREPACDFLRYYPRFSFSRPIPVDKMDVVQNYSTRALGKVGLRHLRQRIPTRYPTAAS